MIEWLEDFLCQFNFILFMVMYDCYFFEWVCDYIVELDQGELFCYSGNYSDYLEKKVMCYEIFGNEYEKNKKMFKCELEWFNC